MTGSTAADTLRLNVANVSPYGTETLAAEFSDWSGAGDRIEINGTAGADEIGWWASSGDGSSPAAYISAGAGNDTLSSGAFHNYIDGGADDDSFVLGGDIADYTFTSLSAGPYVLRISDQRIGAPDGIDDLTGIEWMQFANDGTFALARLLTAPIAVDDTGYVPMDTTLVIDVLQNDTAPDGDTVVVVGASNAFGGSVSATSGGVEFTPDSGFVGIASFDYTISDPFGRENSANVRLNVGPRPAAQVVLD